MDRSKLDSQMDRRAEKMDSNFAVQEDRQPITEYDKFFFTRDIYYEDSVIEAKIVRCIERFNTTIKGIVLDGKGPWILFHVMDVLGGDPEGLIDIGSVVLAKWSQSRRVYLKYMAVSEPKMGDREVYIMSDLMSVSPEEVVYGRI